MASEMTYWAKKGRHQKIYDRLYAKLVPDSGEAGSDAGELLRTVSNVYYDIYNNGGCNLLDAKLSDLETLESLTRTWGINGQAKTFEMIRGYASDDMSPDKHSDNCDCHYVDDDQRHFSLDELRNPLELLVDAVIEKAHQLSRRKVPI
jgi:hypothetical protein